MRPLPIGGALLVALFLWRRRAHVEPTLVVGGALLIIGLLVYGSGLVELPNIEQLIDDAGEVLGQWTYLVVGVMAFLETGAFVGLLAPGETFMVFGGVVAGQGRIELVTMIAICWACAVAGDLTSFALGRRLGRAFLVRHGPKFSITEERLQHVERFFQRHGGKAILIGRFVGIVRAIAPFLAGSSGMRLRRFVPYDIIGAGLWSSTFLVLGYIFWQSFGEVVDYAEKGALALGSLITLIVALVVVTRWLRVPENRHRAATWLDVQLERPLLRPLGGVLRPIWRRTRGPRRFVWQRITPGQLGLEMTTLLAVFVVGAFAFFGLVWTLADQQFTTGDARAMDAVGDLRADWLADVAEAVTVAGSLSVVGAIVLATSVFLLTRRRSIEAVTLPLALALTYAAVHITKAAKDRPRPAEPLVEVSGSSFPSAHAAYAIALVAVAVVLTRTAPGFFRTAAALIVAIVLAVAVALSRVYLEAHFLSDVLAGAGLGAAIFALCAMGALVAVHLRKNHRRA